jgi:tetratricopeptide (TPR) repeat protein
MKSFPTIKRAWTSVSAWTLDAFLRSEETLRKSGSRDQSGKIIVAARKDGLGGRLCSIMNAIDLADRLQLPFYFMWPRVTADHTFNAISSADRVFAREFLTNHHKEFLPSERFILIDGNPVDKSVLDQLREDHRTMGLLVGTWAERVSLEGAFPPSKPASELFSRISLTPRMQEALDLAASADVRDAVAIHIRSGDIIYGDSRFRLFNDKFSPRPLVTEVIRHHVSLGQKVVLFSDDADLLSHLSNEAGGICPKHFGVDQFADADQRALFEIVLMSRCREIIAAFSAFAMTAAFIGGKRVVNLRERFRDVAEKRALLDPRALQDASPMEKAKLLQFVATQLRSVTPRRESIDLLSEASALDPQNTTYRQLRAIFMLRSGKTQQAEDVLKQCAEEHFIQTGMVTAELGRTLKHLYKHKALLAGIVQADGAGAQLPYTLAHYAEVVRATQNATDAMQPARQAWEAQPDSALLLAYFGSRLIETKQYTEAFALMQEGAARHHDVPIVHLLLSESASRRGKNEAALDAAIRAHALAPEDQSISIKLGLMHAHLGQLDEASVLADSLEPVLQSNQAPLLYQYGRLLEAVKRYHSAHEALLEAVKLRPLKTPYRERFSRLDRRLKRLSGRQNLS